MDSTRQAIITVPVLWTYSLSKYALDEVKDTCLLLQDEYTYNVNLLLFCMLCDSLGTTLSTRQLACIREDILLSDKELLEHRAKRRKAKPLVDSSSPLADDERYQRLLRDELTLEAAQQELIVASFLKQIDASECLEEAKIDAGVAQHSEASSLTHYFELMITSEKASVMLKEQQEQLIKVLGKHV